MAQTRAGAFRGSYDGGPADRLPRVVSGSVTVHEAQMQRVGCASLLPFPLIATLS